MKNAGKTLLYAGLFFIPWFLCFPYQFSAWKNSPPDRYDWIFVLWFLMLFPFCIFRKAAPGRGKPNRRKRPMDWLMLIPAAAVTAGGWIFSVNMIKIAGGVWFAWRGSVLVFGRGGNRIPVSVFLILLLGTTSSSYWISVGAGIPLPSAWLLKFAAAGLLTGMTLLSERFREESVGFLAGVAAAVFLYARGDGIFQKVSPPLQPEFTLSATAAGGEFIGQPVRLSGEMRRFFRESKTACYQFADDRRSYHVLAVRCGGNIHEIHPARHCLRSSGARILSEEYRLLRIRGRDFRLLEIVTAEPDGRNLTVVWYSSRNGSTGSFLTFRSRWSPHEDWRVYQISTRFKNHPESAREGIRKLLEILTGDG